MRGKAALPCPTGARGAVKVWERRCLPAARALRWGARPVWRYGALAVSGLPANISRLVAGRAGKGTAGRGFPFPVRADGRFRRGYGGLRPHPLKGHWPLRIPFAAARFPDVATKAGGPDSWAARRDSYFAATRNATRNPYPRSWGRGLSLNRGGAGNR